jgi:hypothetical protein
MYRFFTPEIGALPKTESFSNFPNLAVSFVVIESILFKRDGSADCTIFQMLERTGENT